jgi:uncharacterized integral membrane protein
MTTPHKIQSAAALVLILICTAFVLLNSDPTEVNFLFGVFAVSRAWLVIGFFVAGIFVGWLIHSLVIRANRSRKTRTSRRELDDYSGD